MISQNPLPYIEQLDQRELDEITGIVIHCTETPDLATARDFGEKILYDGSQTGNSGHFYIDLDGSIEQYVPLTHIAHHVSGHNRPSIGVELVNRGRWPDWLHSQSQQPETPYTPEQIQALIGLLQHLEQSLSGLEWIAGHQDLDTRKIGASDDSSIMISRKIDPGPQFPWEQVMTSNRLERRTAE